MVGVILAAGDGKRMKSSSNNDCCKPLMKIHNKRLIEYALDNLVQLGIQKAYIVVGKTGDLIKKSLGYEYKSLKLLYVVQPEQTGLINAFTQALNVVGCDKSVVLQLSDEIFTDLKVEEIKNCIKAGLYDFYCGITFEDNIEKIKGNFSVDTDDKYAVKKCVEKPVTVTNNIKGTGFCIFNSEALQILNNEDHTQSNILFDLCDYINYLIQKNKKGLALLIAEKEFNINTFEDLREAQHFLEAK